MNDNLGQPERSWFQRVMARWIALQVRRPWPVLLVTLALTLPALLFARTLELKTGFDALLPENKRSVIELKRVSARTAGVATLAIVIDGSDSEALKHFSDALLPRLRALGPEWVGTAENGVQTEREFVKRRQTLFLPLAKVRKIHDRVEERFEEEIYGRFDDEPSEPITRESLERELGVGLSEKPGAIPYRDGYYMNRAGTRLVVLVRTPISVGDLERSKELQAKVRAVIAVVNPASFHDSLKVGLTGDVVTSAEHYSVVKNDLTEVGAMGIGMILLVDFLFFLRLRAVLAMALAIGTGVVWTFAVTRFAIGHLNTASGFLVSIIFGNGINFGILLRARYGEARRASASLEEALAVAYRDTLAPTLTVAAAAAAGYISLAATDFRGFRDFGVIGGYGMLLCWLANYLLMPPLLVVFERIRPTKSTSPDRAPSRWKQLVERGLPFGAPFGWLSACVPPIWIASLGAMVTLTAAIATVRYVSNDPFEYHLGKLENDRASAANAATRLGKGLSDITGRVGQDGMAVVTERVDQVKPLLVELEKRRKADGSAPPFQKVISIYDFVPEDQDEKVPLLLTVRKRIARAHDIGKIGAEDWNRIEPYLPPRDLREFGIAELPDKIARPFTERDGTRGRIVYVVPTEGKSVRDLKYLLKWADSFRETRLPSGETIYGSGRAVIFADMLSAVMVEAPKAMLLAALMTTVVVALCFCRGKHGIRATLLVLSALACGIAWMGALFLLLGIKINFLNFIAVPITVGIGVDYAINLIHRWRIQRNGNLATIVRETGGAVVLCSLTTTLGYLALMRSVNPAVRSFGLAAVLGEITCLTAVVVVLPAVLRLVERRGAD